MLTQYVNPPLNRLRIFEMIKTTNFPLVWITGASTGLGRALAVKLAAHGSKVVVSARNQEKLCTLAAEAQSLAGDIFAIPLDVTDKERVKHAYSAITRDYGIPDLCVLNAGTYIPMDAAIFSADTFAKQIDINWMGVVHALDAIIPDLVDRGSGRIAVVGSVSGYRGLRTAAAYGATKAALINMCETLHMELADYGIKVQIVNPGFINTPLTAKNDFRMPSLMPVEKAANALHRGLLSDRFEITFPMRFTWMVKLMRLLPYAIYLPLISWVTKKKS